MSDSCDVHSLKEPKDIVYVRIETPQRLVYLVELTNSIEGVGFFETSFYCDEPEEIPYLASVDVEHGDVFITIAFYSDKAKEQFLDSNEADKYLFDIFFREQLFPEEYMPEDEETDTGFVFGEDFKTLLNAQWWREYLGLDPRPTKKLIAFRDRLVKVAQETIQDRTFHEINCVIDVGTGNLCIALSPKDQEQRRGFHTSICSLLAHMKSVERFGTFGAVRMIVDDIEQDILLVTVSDKSGTALAALTPLSDEGVPDFNNMKYREATVIDMGIEFTSSFLDIPRGQSFDILKDLGKTLYEQIDEAVPGGVTPPAEVIPFPTKKN